MNKKVKKIIIPAVATAVIIGGGFSYASAATNTTSNTLTAENSAQSNEENQSQAELAKQATVTKEVATKTALDQVPGTIGDIELEDEEGTLIYSIEVTAEDGTKQEVEVDATTGEVVKVEAEDDEEEGDDEQSQAELAKQATVTKEAATKTALDQVPGTVGDVELEDENGTVVYSIEVTAEDGTKQEVKVDATSGEVVKVEHNDDEENDDGNEVDDQE
ncbi:PepSY domain-containing protein [Oceanobacillus chungangensis]|uniref:PepSY domain-containing protein n=1 Tax=Oceanobacillus chungangensis TaxID=1229152 RepID=A0A3D8PNK4_9BACI|nr:PepSY domain-containing protein [Oceanobacillus chungangensis]RDW17683.1 hypothetical protein CWR45_10075 [Oceanobacillus chungangensis]